MQNHCIPYYARKKIEIAKQNIKIIKDFKYSQKVKN